MKYLLLLLSKKSSKTKIKLFDPSDRENLIIEALYYSLFKKVIKLLKIIIPTKRLLLLKDKFLSVCKKFLITFSTGLTPCNPQFFDLSSAKLEKIDVPIRLKNFISSLLNPSRTSSNRYRPLTTVSLGGELFFQDLFLLVVTASLQRGGEGRSLSLTLILPFPGGERFYRLIQTSLPTLLALNSCFHHRRRPFFFFFPSSIPRWNVSSPTETRQRMCLVTSNAFSTRERRKFPSVKSLGWNLSLKEPPFPPHTRSTSLPHRRRTIVEFNYQTSGEGEEEEGRSTSLSSTFPFVHPVLWSEPRLELARNC